MSATFQRLRAELGSDLDAFGARLDELGQLDDQRTAVSLPNDGVLAGTLGTQSGRLILRYVKL